MNLQSNSQFVEGLKDCLPVMVVVIFFGMLFGATAVSGELTLGQSVLSSAAVPAGASQFVFLDLYGQKGTCVVNFTGSICGKFPPRSLFSFTGPTYEFI